MVVGGVIGGLVLLSWFVIAYVRGAGNLGSGVVAPAAQEALADFAAGGLELQTVEQILQLSGQAANAIFGAGHSVFFLHGVESGSWDVRFSEDPERVEPVPPALRGCFGWFRHNTTIAVKGDLADARFGAMRGPLRQIMDNYKVDVVMPLVHGEQMLAAVGIALGRSPSALDRSLMKKFRLEATAATANVRLHREASHVISLAREVDLASAAQQALVPEAFDGAHGPLAWAGHFEEAGEAGSDFWSAYPVGEKLLVVVGDATGIGLAGSMVSAVVKSCCDAIVDAHGKRVSPASLLGTLNRALWRPEKPVHMTCFAAMFDPTEGTVRYANAGHPFPYHMGHAGKLGVLAGAGPLLGDEPQSRYHISEHTVTPGESVVFFTDGIVTCRNPEGVEYGERRLQKLLLGAVGLSAAVVRDRIADDVRRFRDMGAREDDEVIVVVKVAE